VAGSRQNVQRNTWQQERIVVMQSVLENDHPWMYTIVRQISRIGVNQTVFVVTAAIMLCSVLFTCVCLLVFQGSIDVLGIVLCTVAPMLIFPLPARLFFQMFLKLQATEKELLQKNKNLEEAIDQLHTLSGLLPICSFCKKIRDDKGYWREVEQYIEDHSQLRLTHGFCPDCINTMYPQFGDKILSEKYQADDRELHAAGGQQLRSP
jgi:hypothetical protein